MRDYWLTRELLQSAGMALGLMAVIGVGLAFLSPTKRRTKVFAATVVGTLLLLPGLTAVQELQKQNAAVRDYEKRLSQARSLFERRCTTAGEKIFRTVEDVEGILLLNVRERGTSASVLQDPYWPDAALPNEPGDEGYVMTFLLWEQYQDKRNDRGYLNNVPSDLPGYEFVDMRDSTGVVNRFRLVLPAAREMSKQVFTGEPSRYAVGFVNMTEPTDRRLWVAGTKVTVTDNVTGELLAEKIWYAMEPGQGSTVGERSPWAFAVQCPRHLGWSGASTRFFVDKVLKPTKVR